MNMKKNLIALGAAVLLGLTGCGTNAQVNVEQAGMLSTAAASSDKFAGIVVSENVVEIERDTQKQIKELFVEAGDEVRANEKLFEYDTDTLSLTIDKQELEMDKLEQQVKDLNTKVKDLDKQIKDLENQIKKEKDKTAKAKLQDNLATLNRDRQAANIDLTSATYEKKTLQTEIDYNKDMLKNAVVHSPIKGTVRAVNESGTPYITIQKTGAYQVKGTLNELSLNAGIMEGVSVTILSRIDPTAFWTGTVSLVDYNSTSTNEYDNMYGNVSDGMTSSTSYPFYITLDSTEGLLLGQHVYIQIAAAPAGDDTLRIPESYVMDLSVDPETFQTLGTVWGVNMETRTLTKLSVTLGEYDHTYGTYTVVEGITAESYLADPADPGVKEGAAVYLRGELEYMGQTEPTESTGPEELTLPQDTIPGIPPEAADGDPIEDPVSENGFQVITPETEESPEEDTGFNGMSGSLVIPTDDPDKQ